ncbi:cellulase family glycosylhydrolase [Actinoplanes sp. KI2]|uniref:cellulase family glycosylhydrolase n=1 Tax=Actinoplanes sp. KI2 TaxID=2983315 RepID=UPI0021D58802|nr:cellulase family glycosylhydrolase [Actinoplanes sp. KI2]MCU7728543.1 cellulase family glycosylhydrolase [Actinoplanes sp. KI2]
MVGLALPTTPAFATTKAGTAKTAAARKTTTAKKTTAATATVPTKSSRLAAVKAAKAINYYPSTAGWSKMWSSFDATKVDADFAKAQALGATSVRAIVFPTTFGYPTPNPSYTAKLDTFVKLANTHGMTVKLSLFDWWDGYSDVAGSKVWATSLLKPYKDDPRIISVELQNEIDPTNTTAVTWAKQMIPALRTAFPTMPLTLSNDGESGPAGLARIKAALGSIPLDYYDYHFYGNAERALPTIRQAQAAVAPAPIVIGETGMNTLENTEGEQAAFLARVFEAAKAAGVNSVSPWTLNDFASGAIPNSIVSKRPPQYSYGMYRTNGVAKPAAAVVKAEFTGTALPASLTDNGFENAAGQTPWRPFMPELGMATKTTTAAHTGKWSVSLSNTGKTSAGTPSYRVAPIQPVQPGQKWHGEVWAKGNATTGTTQIAVSWFDVKDKWLGGINSASLPTGTVNWTKLTVDGVAPAGTASMQVHLKSGANTGTVWFDDVVIRQA